MNNIVLKDTLTELASKGLKRELGKVRGPQGARIIFNGCEVLNFCSNNYLGLADDPLLREAAIESVQQEGLGSGASRLVCGNMCSLYSLEEKIARFKGQEACLVFSTGYMANVGIISSLFGKNDMIFSDKLNHASIIDGILLSGASYRRYAHLDTEALEGFLEKTCKESPHGRRVIITDSVFSMDGDIAPLNKIVGLAQKYQAMIMIDEAHAFGIMGKSGKGAAEHFGCEDKIDIQMGTLSKAAGAFGAYCCGKKELVDYLINKARSFIYTTGMPPAIAAAALKGIEIIENDSSRRERLWENTRFVHKELKMRGFDTMNSQTPIIPIVVGSAEKAKEFSEKLLAQKIFIQAIRPPTVPVNTARLRLTVMATHSLEDLEYLIEKIDQVGRDLDMI